MSRVLWSLGKSRQARWLAAALTVTAIALSACGGDDGGAAGTTASPSIKSDSTVGDGADGEPILILTRVTLTPASEVVSTGKILDGSTIGDSPFCPGGTIKDKHGNPDPTKEPFGLVDRTITCQDGTLRMGFTPGVPQGRTQAGPWKVVSGTDSYERWQGSGQMETKYDRGNDTKGRETFTGTVTQ